MLIFIYGNDTFRVQEKVHEMKKRFMEKFDPSGMNLAVFSDKPAIGDVMQAVQSPPFLAERRMVIVRDLLPTIKKADAEPWIAGFAKTDDSTILIFWETTTPKKLEKTEVFKQLKKQAEVHHYPFPELATTELSGWVQERAQQLGTSLDPAARNELIRRVGPDLWRMQHELEKLSAFASGRTISLDDIHQLVHAEFEDQMFQFIDAVSKKDVRGAMRLLEEHRLSGATDHHIFSMLARQVRILIGARSLLDENPGATKQDLASAMSLHPFVAQKALQQARQFTTQKLLNTHRALFRLDLAIKTGKAQPALAVDLSVLRMTAGS